MKIKKKKNQWSFVLLCFSFAAPVTRTWHDDGPVGFKRLRVDLDGRHGVVTCVSVQQVALKTKIKKRHLSYLLSTLFHSATCPLHTYLSEAQPRPLLLSVPDARSRVVHVALQVTGGTWQEIDFDVFAALAVGVTLNPFSLLIRAGTNTGQTRTGQVKYVTTKISEAIIALKHVNQYISKISAFLTQLYYFILLFCRVTSKFGIAVTSQTE